MDLYFAKPIFLYALALIIILYCFWRTKTKTIRIPQPSGKWPVIGHLHLLTTKIPICKILGSMSDKYGPLFSLQLGYNRLLVVSSWEIAKECFTTNDGILASRPNIAAGRYLGYDNAIFALAPYGPYWREIRKIATMELLSSHRLEKLKHVRISELDSFILDLYATCRESKAEDFSAQVDMGGLLEHLTFNINLRMIVGKRYAGNSFSEENSEAWRYKKAIHEAMYLTAVFVMEDAIPYLKWLDLQGHVRAMKRTAKELDSVIGAWLDEHVEKRSKGNSESDFMDVMLSTLPEDIIMCGHARDTVVKATSLILTFTGAESTSLGLTWALSLLLNNPKILKTAQEELDSKVGKNKWVQESDMENLKYIQAIVKETLRLYPPGPVTGLREATEDCKIVGHHVPKGTQLIVNIWKLQRDPRVWTRPSEFRPERFLTSHGDGIGMDVKGQNFEYIPFSSGRRSCPGMVFGLQVVHLTLARLIQGFNMETFGGLLVDMEEGLGLALLKRDPLRVIIKPRLDAQLYNDLMIEG